MTTRLTIRHVRLAATRSERSLRVAAKQRPSQIIHLHFRQIARSLKAFKVSRRIQTEPITR
jgi:hypothetical protein